MSDVVYDPAVAAAVLAYEDASAAFVTAASDVVAAVKAFRAAHPAVRRSQVQVDEMSKKETTS